MKLEKVNQELILQFETNLKLDLVDLGTGESVIEKSRRPDHEIHFVRIEGRHPPINLSMDGLKDAAKLVEIENWTITDFDNCLGGNPHV